MLRRVRHSELKHVDNALVVIQQFVLCVNPFPCNRFNWLHDLTCYFLNCCLAMHLACHKSTPGTGRINGSGTTDLEFIASRAPSWPCEFTPQHSMLPAPTRAHVWANPAQMAVTETPVSVCFVSAQNNDVRCLS
jgi:hypothetical protein